MFLAPLWFPGFPSLCRQLVRKFDLPASRLLDAGSVCLSTWVVVKQTCSACLGQNPRSKPHGDYFLPQPLWYLGKSHIPSPPSPFLTSCTHTLQLTHPHTPSQPSIPLPHRILRAENHLIRSGTNNRNTHNVTLFSNILNCMVCMR